MPDSCHIRIELLCLLLHRVRAAMLLAPLDRLTYVCGSQVILLQQALLQPSIQWADPSQIKVDQARHSLPLPCSCMGTGEHWDLNDKHLPPSVSMQEVTTVPLHLGHTRHQRVRTEDDRDCAPCL